jgi:uncharacterized membrane protein
MREEHNKVSSIITGACAFVGAMILWNYNFIIGAIVGGLIGAVIQYNRSMSFDAEFTNKYGE